MTIGQVAKQSGLAPSAIRFYEQAAVLPRPVRISGKRYYDSAVLGHLAVIGRAKACGFSLEQIRKLFSGFRKEAKPSERWQTLARQKMIELDEMTRKIDAMKEMLERPCACQDFAECGRRIFANKGAAPPLA